ncbi:hypothetical protein E2C01_044434 [Portunus trituberculatus]|uniref:Uncharacterized protein n=1 Tax=Portunus trituberculatus TaxID=210409 RepID=A0A5B7G2B5_PORTR|nr:hypothetical protein [Portunus trituberculatus]
MRHCEQAMEKVHCLLEQQMTQEGPEHLLVAAVGDGGGGGDGGGDGGGNHSQEIQWLMNWLLHCHFCCWLGVVLASPSGLPFRLS